jgi:mono/diheme cytochrome c family protein
MGPGMMGGNQNGQPPPLTLVPTATPGGETTVSYQRDIQPIFTQYCVSCHGGSAGLWLDTYERVLAGGDRGPVIVPSNPEGSELYHRITGQSQPQMPLNGGSLSQRQIEAIQTWILEGAPNN